MKALNPLYLAGTLFPGRDVAQLFAEFSQLFPSIRDALSSLLQLLQGVFLLVGFFPSHAILLLLDREDGRFHRVWAPVNV